MAAWTGVMPTRAGQEGQNLRTPRQEECYPDKQGGLSGGSQGFVKFLSRPSAEVGTWQFLGGGSHRTNRWRCLWPGGVEELAGPESPLLPPHKHIHAKNNAAPRHGHAGNLLVCHVRQVG